MEVTWLDGNSWLWELADQRILVDPWLVGDLTFGGAPWLFRGTRPQVRPLPQGIDLLLLSQGLPDHAHPETLEALDKTIPVVASPNGAKVARSQGFHQVQALAPGETCDRGQVVIQALPGAPIGPLTVENGYLLTDTTTGQTLFYEPHGFHPPSLRGHGPVDVVITPMMDLTLPLFGPILRGRQGAQELADWLDPQVMLPTAHLGEAEYQGFLLALIQGSGGAAELRHHLGTQGKSTQVLDPQVGVPLRWRTLKRKTLA